VSGSTLANRRSRKSVFPSDICAGKSRSKGYGTVEGASGPYPVVNFTLDLEGSLPPEMVRVLGGHFQWGRSMPVELPDYLLSEQPSDGSFMPQCYKWVDLCGSSGRQIAGQQSDHSQHKRYSSEGFGVVGADTEQQAAHKVH
jgi:hypothetical protein